MKGWYGNRQAHSLASRGISTREIESKVLLTRRQLDVADIDEIYSFGKLYKNLFYNKIIDVAYEIWLYDNVLYKIERDFDKGESNVEDYLDIKLNDNTEEYLDDVWGYKNIENLDTITYKAIYNNIDEHNVGLKNKEKWAMENNIQSDYEIVYMYNKIKEFREIW